MFRKGRRKELHLFRGDINLLSFLVTLCHRAWYEFPLKGGKGFVRRNLFFDEPPLFGHSRDRVTERHTI